ncbi:HAD family hydrolase [Dictyobacter arantiisoli]|uniref:Haloacid dehalogenase n=1 Tax=Dictyobacter arantiisoli TaxID=2014874 RepID=A0A5A5T7Q4_9CHLR|nr:HAD-IA family hydrolase [Dictyobacter arantiisoli]GCF07437.1 haloacid dehalogenase [Dictyobacter arantiisoli]
MRSPVIWQHPDLSLPHPFDTIFFDVDGVLIETSKSFRAANIAVTEYIVGTLNQLEWRQNERAQLVTLEDIGIFKQAGGFNNDWDMCYLLSTLETARLREWRGTSLAQRSTVEWGALAHEAAEQGQGGRPWVEATFPASACTDYETIVNIFNESYWGVEELQRRFGREPRYLPDATGFVHNEKMLFEPDFFSDLQQAGITRLGMITGRVGPEVDSALERLEKYCGGRWWDVVVSSTLYTKPDPQALRYAIARVGAQGGLYIGDTADDLDLVRRYKATKSADEPIFVAAMVVKEDEIDIYRQRGADVLVHSVESLPGFLTALEEF